MTHLDRIKVLAGVESSQAQLTSALQESKRSLGEAHDKAIKQVQAGARVDEGLFGSLMAALSTVGQASLLGARSIADQAKKLAAPIKQLYLDNKAKEELKELIQHTSTIAGEFEELEKDARTVLSRDQDVRTAVDVFKAALKDFAGKLTARGALVQANESQEQITDQNVGQLVEQFGALSFSKDAPIAKQRWVNQELAPAIKPENHDLIMSVIANKLTFTELKKLLAAINKENGVATVEEQG